MQWVWYLTIATGVVAVVLLLLGSRKGHSGTVADESSTQVGTAEEPILEQKQPIIQPSDMQPDSAQPSTPAPTGPTDASQGDRVYDSSCGAVTSTIDVPEAESLNAPIGCPGSELKAGDTLSHFRSPEKRGGRHRGPKSGIAQPIQPRRSPSSIRSCLVIWKREQQWHMAVELDSDVASTAGVFLTQGSRGLSRDELEPECWLLADVMDEILVSDPSHAIQLSAGTPFAARSFLLFRLVGTRGRQVAHAGLGSYVVIAPASWTRDAERSGPAPVTDEPVSLPELRAHFFEIGDPLVEKIVFVTPGGFREVPTSAPLFELVGKEIPDHSGNLGPLFGQGVPSVRAEPKTWERVATVILGHEGAGKRRWRCDFPPDPQDGEVDLSTRISQQGSGWYFLRFYDQHDRLLESTDFRFVGSLFGMEVEPVPPLPEGDGHGEARICFLHEPGFAIEALDQRTWRVSVEPSESRTVLVFPPNPSLDLTHWRISSASGKGVEIALVIGRLWWVIAPAGEEPDDWQDMPICLPREEFHATSLSALWVRFPAPRWCSTLGIAFQGGSESTYRVPVTTSTMAVPLREFGDAEQLRSGEPVILCLSHHGPAATSRRPVVQVWGICRCDRCDFSCSNVAVLQDHYFERHSASLIRELSYDEHRKRNVTLPATIYRCSCCERDGRSFYVETNRVGHYATGEILDHIQLAHPGQPKAFRVVTGVDEIRNCVIPDLPHLYSCELCGVEGEGPYWARAHLPGCVTRHIEGLGG